MSFQDIKKIDQNPMTDSACQFKRNYMKNGVGAELQLIFVDMMKRHDGQAGINDLITNHLCQYNKLLCIFYRLKSISNHFIHQFKTFCRQNGNIILMWS
jgi:hypothetical protein